MKTKLKPVAELDCDTGKHRVVWQWCRGGLVQGRFFDGTPEGFEEALKFAMTISGNPGIFCEIPKACSIKRSDYTPRLNRDRRNYQEQRR